ncbi:MAG: RNB domain-containing ribonuclease [Spirochaetaceae bacterium]|jgi:exoribonuclease-2|nr:RNB domain-containing ribonuclease [Spirochaetaceae bacterium]
MNAAKIKQGALALYKGKCAIVREISDGKITLLLKDAEGEPRVREKDIEVLHPGPVESFAALEPAELPDEEAKLYWELLLDGQNSGSVFTLQDLAALMDEGWTARSAWRAYLLLKDGIYFSGTPGISDAAGGIKAKTREEAGAMLAARAAKETGRIEREEFLARLKERRLNLSTDAVFMQDVEALALGRTDKSRTLRDAGIPETPIDAHKTLTASGVWDYFVNPYPAREGLALKPARAEAPPPPNEERVDLSHIPAYAIDNEGSADPDDAVSVLEENGNPILYVHVADPAASIYPGSEADIEARNRGATVYLPEGVCRMLHDDALTHYALGLSEFSPALSFKLTLRKDGSIDAVDILKSTVKVSRLTYEQADTILNTIEDADLACGANLECSFNLETCKKALTMLNRIAKRNIERRLNAGAAIIEFPEPEITVQDRNIKIEIYPQYETAALVRECMLLAGEGAAQWALGRRVPFPFVSQEGSAEAADADLAPGLAGAYQLRRSMRPRVLSAKPGVHWGLGLDVYTQVTSPLRRYTDLLCHQQIRAVLDGREPLDEDEVLCRLAVSERGAIAAARAGRASSAHWTRVYLSGKINTEWEAAVLDRKGQNTAVVFITALGLETQITLYGESLSLKPGGVIRIRISSVKVEEGIVHAAPAL